MLISNQGSSGNHWVHALDLYISELNKKALLNNFKVCRHSNTHVLVLPDLGEPDWHSFKLILRGGQTPTNGGSVEITSTVSLREKIIFQNDLLNFVLLSEKFSFDLLCHVESMFYSYCSLAKYHSAVYYTAV